MGGLVSWEAVLDSYDVVVFVIVMFTRFIEQTGYFWRVQRFCTFFPVKELLKSLHGFYRDLAAQDMFTAEKSAKRIYCRTVVFHPFQVLVAITPFPGKWNEINAFLVTFVWFHHFHDTFDVQVIHFKEQPGYPLSVFLYKLVAPVKDLLVLYLSTCRKVFPGGVHRGGDIPRPAVMRESD